MRIEIWTDDNGYKQRVYLRDGDDNKEIGIPSNPPDLEQLDWNAIKRDLHNLLTERGLITWQDVQASQTGIDWVVRKALSNRIVNLYRMEAKNEF